MHPFAIVRQFIVRAAPPAAAVAGVSVAGRLALVGGADPNPPLFESLPALLECVGCPRGEFSAGVPARSPGSCCSHYVHPAAGAPAPIGKMVPYTGGNAGGAPPVPPLAAPAFLLESASPPAKSALMLASGTPAPPPSSAGPEPPRAAVADPLVAEGYLKKRRGFGQTRSRWFRVTRDTAAYFTEDGGPRLASLRRDEIHSVTDRGGCLFEVRTTVPFGRAHTATLLEADSALAKKRWVAAFYPGLKPGGSAFPGQLLAEGPMERFNPKEVGRF
jgi:hypothetical protein